MVLSGLIFTGVAFASSGADSLLKNSAASEAKVPEVQQVSDVEDSPESTPAAVTILRQTSTVNNPAPFVKPSATPKPTTAPRLNVSASSSPNTITGLKNRNSEEESEHDNDDAEKADDSDKSAINNAFQKTKDGD